VSDKSPVQAYFGRVVMIGCVESPCLPRSHRVLVGRCGVSLGRGEHPLQDTPSTTVITGSDRSGCVGENTPVPGAIVDGFPHIFRRKPGLDEHGHKIFLTGLSGMRSGCAFYVYVALSLERR